MPWWLWRRRARITHIDDEAEALIGELGVDAYAEACRKQDEASSKALAGDWGRVALTVAKHRGLDASTPIPADEVACGREPDTTRGLGLNSELSLLGLLNGAGLVRPHRFRIQLVRAAPGGKPFVLKEVGIDAEDESAAIVAAAKLPLPPTTNGLRILDRDGREVFARRKTESGLQALGRLDRQNVLNLPRTADGAQLAFARVQRGVRSVGRSVGKMSLLILNHGRKIQVQGGELIPLRIGGSYLALVGWARSRVLEAGQYWRHPVGDDMQTGY
jgi:hypothetical protein